MISVLLFASAGVFAQGPAKGLMIKKRKTKYRIVWLDDASYILKPWNKITEMAKTPRYKLVDVADDHYVIRVLDQSSLGPIITVHFK